MSDAPTWPALDPFADAVNPLLGVVIFALVLLALRRRRWREGWGLAITLLVALALAYSLAYLDRVSGAFGLFGLDFSTHGAVHLAAWAAMLAARPVLWPAALAVGLGYHVLMALQGYHTSVDLLGTVAVVGLPLAVLATVARPIIRRRADSAPGRQNAAP
jgi:hypothetical protein